MDAKFIERMAHLPDLPNAATLRWVSFISLFNVEFTYILAEKHKAPDGLSQRPHMPEDSDDTIVDFDSDGAGPYIKGITMFEPPSVAPFNLSPLLVPEVEAASLRNATHTRPWERRGGDQIHIMSNQLHNTSLQTNEKETSSTNEDTSPNFKSNTPSVHDNKDKIFGNIKQYLATLEIPENIKNKNMFIRKAHSYFIYKDILWKKSKEAPRCIIMDLEVCKQLIRQAHNKSGHRGRQPTYKKLVDFYFWPSMVNDIAIHC